MPSLEMSKELENIKKQLEMLAERQEYLEDTLLSAEDEKALRDSRKDLSEGKTVKLVSLKKNLGI